MKGEISATCNDSKVQQLWVKLSLKKYFFCAGRIGKMVNLFLAG